MDWKKGDVVYSAGDGYRGRVEIQRHTVVRVSDKQIKLDSYVVYPLGKSQGMPVEFQRYLADTEVGAVRLLAERMEEKAKGLENQALACRGRLATVLAEVARLEEGAEVKK